MEKEKSSNIKLAERIENLRTQKNMSQVNLATLIGISQESISAMERGVSNPKLSTLLKMSEVLECSIDYLVGVSDIKSPAIDYNLLGPHQKHLINNFKTCNLREREILLLLSDLLANKQIIFEFDDDTTLIKNFISTQIDENK